MKSILRQNMSKKWMKNNQEEIETLNKDGKENLKKEMILEIKIEIQKVISHMVEMNLDTKKGNKQMKSLKPEMIQVTKKESQSIKSIKEEINQDMKKENHQMKILK
jgi:hypothetical protein